MEERHLDTPAEDTLRGCPLTHQLAAHGKEIDSPTVDHPDLDFIEAAIRAIHPRLAMFAATLPEHAAHVLASIE
jgi:hypothetical protein